MKRSAGVTVVGILILVLSAMMLIGAVLGGVFMLSAPMPAQTIPNAPPPEQMRMMSIMGMGFVGLMAAFGVAIGVGILRLWSWARYTAVVVGFLVAGICVFSALVVFAMPIPETPGTPPGFPGGLRIGMAVFYFFWALLYALVSCYLLRASVGRQFQRISLPEGAPEQEPKPIAVLTVAGLTLVALLSLPYFLFMDLPVLLFGVEIAGGAGKLAMMLWILLFGIIGIALIRRFKTALWAAVALYGLGIVNALLSFRGGVLERYYQHLPKYGPYNPQLSASLLRMGIVLGLIGTLIPIALLFIGKKKYFAWCERKQVPVAPPQA
ncbi:MAG TPA: hypothetical protein VFU86_22800 [Terriglobales bacterium]|nr:hypothetical protein [Terriglobales bacterium]